MRTIDVLLGGPADYAGWRNQARRLLAAGVPPEAVEWRVPGEAPGLFSAGAIPDAAAEAAPTAPRTAADLSERPVTDEMPESSPPGANPRPAARSRALGDPSDQRVIGEMPEASTAGADHRAPAASRVPGESSERPVTHKMPESSPPGANPRPAASRAPGGLSERRVTDEMPEISPAGTGTGTGSRAPAACHVPEGSSEWRVAGDEGLATLPAGATGHAETAARALGDSSDRRVIGQMPEKSPAGADHRAEAASPVPGDLSERRDASETPRSFPAQAVPSPAPGADRPAPTHFRASGDSSKRRMGGDAPRPSPVGAAPSAPTVPRAFVQLSETAIRHRDPERFSLLYRALWRLTHGEPALMRVATDPDIVRLESMAKAVRRDAHKMHAFVRFREIGTEDGPRFVSWFESEHHILEAEAGFFVRRFAAMRWSILTPAASAHWDGATLAMGPGARRADAPAEDAKDELWRAYYASIFNPARLKPDAMRAEMPVKYWRNLPEARLIPRLIAEAPRRAAEMVERGASAPAPRRQRNVHWERQPVVAFDVTEAMPADLFTAAVDPAEGLAALRAEMLALNSLPPWTADATQMVFGEGPVGAPLLFVGEQPGDEEDIAGKPFVGPAGRMFNKALEEAGIPRSETYVTNAVKHFKFKPTGRRRLHQSPDAGDITYYRPFLKREIDLVGPQLVVTLGATALRALSGKPLAINKTRGEAMPMPDGPPIFPTVHPSYLLRLPDPDSKAREYERFIADLKRAHREVA